MELTSDGIHYEFDRKMYWTRITAQLDDGEATILASASRIYIMDQYHIKGEITDEHKDRWLNVVLDDIRNSNKEIIVGKVYRKTYAHTAEGHENGMKFLTEEVTP